MVLRLISWRLAAGILQNAELVPKAVPALVQETHEELEQYPAESVRTGAPDALFVSLVVCRWEANRSCLGPCQKPFPIKRFVGGGVIHV
jgi:hypothetical protein